MVIPEPWVIVWLDAELLNIVTIPPAVTVLVFTVTPPVVIGITLPASVEANT